MNSRQKNVKIGDKSRQKNVKIGAESRQKNVKLIDKYRYFQYDYNGDMNEKNSL